MNIDERTARKYLQLKASADRRGIEFNLTLVGVKNLVKSKKCRYTGVELTSEEGKPNQLTIDRINNNLGYVTGNVVACAKEFNERKGNMQIEDMQKVLSILK